MRDDQPYYYFDGYKMGQEMQKKSKEHQGHHCSGKCTKLPIQKMPYDHLLPKQEQPKEKECPHIDQTRYPINRDDIVECSECGILKPKEKDCEHDWDKHPIIPLCKKCRLPRFAQFKKQQDPFWLKCGDVIRPKLKENIEIKDFKFGTYWYFSDNQNYKIITEPESFLLKFENIASLEFDKKNFTPDKFKKIKLVSPAVYKDVSQNWCFSNKLYSSLEECKKDFRIFDNFPFIWPAKDQFGKDIFYEVEG